MKYYNVPVITGRVQEINSKSLMQFISQNYFGKISSLLKILITYLLYFSFFNLILKGEITFYLLQSYWV